MDTLIFLFGLSLIWVLWYTLRGLHETAFRICKTSLSKQGYQLLDNSLAFHGFSLSKPIEKCHCLQRAYRFEFSRDGESRDSGQLWFCGKKPYYLVLQNADQREWIQLSQ